MRRLTLTLAVCFLGAALLSGWGGARGEAATERPRVLLVLGSPCAEDNFVCNGFAHALRRTGVRGRIVAPNPREDRTASLSLLAGQGYRLIVVDFSWGDVVRAVARRFPKVRFVLVDLPPDAVTGRLANVSFLAIRTHEASFLAGWLAAKLERRRPGRDAVGIVGGAPFQPVQDFVIGFRAGAKRASPGIAVLTGYSNDFADPRKCEAIAQRQIARGAGVVFNVAGSCGLGTLDAARRTGTWGIGVDVDQSSFGSHVLTSVVKHFDVPFAILLRQRPGVRASGRRLVLGLGEGAAGLGRISPRVPKSLVAELGGVRRRIVAGEIRVPGVAPPAVGG